jgi:hypothetical protein
MSEEGTVDDPGQAAQQQPSSSDALDDALLGRLRTLAGRLDAVPDEAVLAARSAWAYRRMDAALAELVEDSALEFEPSGVRSDAGDNRLLTFSAEVAQIDVEVVVDGSRRRLVGQCIPGTVLEVTVRDAGGERLIPTDDLGRFELDVDAGLISLRCAWPHTGHVVETAWVRV